MANKMVEMTFAIGAALTGSFGNAFGKAGQALGELQKQSSNAQKVAGQIGSYQKMQGAIQQSSEKLNAARMKVKELGQQMKSAGTPTAALKKQFTAANVEAHRLEVALGSQRKKLGELRTELKGAGVDTNHLTSEQARLTQQSKKLEDAQTRLQKSRAALQATREKLSWNNIKGDLIKAAGIGVSLGAPVMEAAEFEHAAARLNAVAFSGGGRNAEKDAKSFKKLQEQARQLGRDTQFTAVQAAQSQENLARAGFDANEIIAAMPGLLDMAAAEGMDLATAADIMASSLRGFGLEAKDAGRVSNILAQTSAASNSSITGLGESMKYVAPVASGLGVSVEETAAMLGVMADAGIKGSQGGTALRAAFLRLSKEPKAVAKALGELGIKARDAQGNMREMPELMQALSKRMKDMGSADKMKYLSNIFGSEAASGMLAVMEASTNGKLQGRTRLNRESSGQLQALSKSTGLSVEELRAGMQDADKYARALGISFGDLSVYTAMLAQNTELEIDTNKALTQAFSRITDKPKEVQKALKSYGIVLKDDKGRMRDFNAILIDLYNNMKDMKPPDQLKELTKIFGKEGAQAVRELMKGMGKGGLYDQYSEIANSATGVGKEMADKVLATFWGQKELAKSAISDLMITIGDVLLPTVESVVKTFSEWTASLGKLATEHPEVTKWIVGIVAGLSALSVGITAIKYAWLGIKLPFQTAKVAFDVLSLGALKNADTLAEGAKSAGLFSKIGGKLSSAAKGIGKTFSAIGSGLSKALSGIMNMGKSLINGLFSPMGLKILLIAGLIAGLAAAVYLVYKNWDAIKEWWNSWTLKDVFAVIKDYAFGAIEYVKNLIAPLTDWLSKYFIVDFDGVFEGFKTALGGAIDLVFNLLSAIKSLFTLDFSGLWESLKASVDSCKNIFAGIGEMFTSLFVIDVSRVIDGLKSVFGGVVEILAGVGEIIAGIFTFDFSSISEGFMKFCEGAKNTLLGLGETIAGLFNIDFSGVWDSFMSGFDSACSYISGKLGELTSWVGSGLSSAWDWTLGLFGFGEDSGAQEQAQEQAQLRAQIQDITVLNKMSEGFAERVAEMTSAWQPFKSSLGEGFEQIYSVMQGIADRIRGVTIPAVNELASALSQIATEVSSIVQAGGLVSVRAENKEDAEQRALDAWKNTEIILDEFDDFEGVETNVLDDGTEDDGSIPDDSVIGGYPHKVTDDE